LSRNITILFVIIAVCLGFLAAMAANQYIKKRTSEGRLESAGATQVVVARGDLPVATTLGTEDVRVIRVPASVVPKGAFTDSKAILGRGTATAIDQGEIITESRLTPVGVGGGLPAMIREGYRAITVRVNDVVGVAGFIVPNTHVDVFTTLRPRGGETAGTPGTKLILQNIRVLAAGPYLERDKDNKPVKVTAVTLEVTPEQAEIVSHAQNEGEIRLALRNRLDNGEVSTPGVTTSVLLAGRGGPAKSPSILREGIEVVLGTKVTHQSF
jgi:pilus assembly protein CpaB